MEKKYFSLELNESNKLTKIAKVIFGIVCLSLSVYWIVYNLTSLQSVGVQWISVVFIMGFGFYMIWSGMGFAGRFIEIEADFINLKRNPVLPVIKLSAEKIKEIKFFPLSVSFILTSGKQIILRFGTTYYENNSKITDEIINFAELNKVPFEIMDDEL
jgi:hypothetical protein